MSNYLKKTLFTLLILMMPYMNFASKAMDDGDYEGSSVRSRKVSFVTEDQKDVSSFVTKSVSSQVASLEESPTSWASYLLSPAKMAIQCAYDVVNFTTQNPKKTMIIGVLLTYQFTAVAAQNCTGCYQCICDCTYPSGSGRGPFTYGKVESTQTCINVCQAKTQWVGGFVGCR